MTYIGIDLSTKTGIVTLDNQANVLVAEELTSKHKQDPVRMIDLNDMILSWIKKSDIVAIEGFSYGSRGRGIDFQFGVGHYLRNTLYLRDINYTIVTPSQVKKYATGKGNTSKDNMILPIYKKWDFEHDSDNVRDAYVLARIMYDMDNSDGLSKYQADILKDLRKQE